MLKRQSSRLVGNRENKQCCESVCLKLCDRVRARLLELTVSFLLLCSHASFLYLVIAADVKGEQRGEIL